MRFIRKILILSVVVLAMPCISQAARSWETLKGSDRMQQSRIVKHTADVEVRAAHGAIIISTAKPVQVRVFSILGQLVSQETLPAGVSVLELNMHGVFIVKIGDTTCKVAL